MRNPLQFRVSSALKNVIGSDLINDDFIAVFELVKNSYDAHATCVEVFLENIYSPNAKIIIKDNGKGMSYDDLINKWLFVAYSAKKDGTEEDNYDFRDKIKVKRAYAGAKGIGRFSCDRLGSNLYLESKKDEENSQVEVLITDWNKFDDDIKDEFINISVIHETIPESTYDLEYGTVLEITNLKSSWNRDKLLSLKDALAKLINPDSKNISNDFEIYLHVNAEKQNDKREKEYRKIVNGKIRNVIFDTLDLKTTRLVSRFNPSNPEEIETTLYEGGKFVYKVIESSPYKSLHDLECEIYYLNRSAKTTFSRRMGLQPVEYGHIFVYKNGLRIFPYGERGEDPLKMDNRKAQGRTRYLGTREVIGYIKISGENPLLKETSSRGQGLSKTDTYFELVEWFYHCLKRVEKYIIDIVDWGNFLSNEDFINFNNFFVKGDVDKGTLEIRDVNENLKNLIDSLTSAKNLVSLEVAPNILQILDNKSSNSVQTQLSTIKEKIESGNFDKEEILKEIQETGQKLERLKFQKDEAENESDNFRVVNESINLELDSEKQKSSYLLATRRTLSPDADGLIHTIKINNIEIKEGIDILLDMLDDELMDVEKFRERLGYIKLNAERSLKMTEFVTRSDFNEDIERRNIDIVQFVFEYLTLYQDNFNHPFSFQVLKNNVRFIKNLSVLNLSIVLDNLISNSLKWHADEICIEFSIKNNKDLVVLFSDNGQGLVERFITNPLSIFELGVRENSPNGGFGGSGIGLYYSKSLLEKMGAKIRFIGNDLKLSGATFEIIFTGL
jgi:signal transduction histidine kinase